MMKQVNADFQKLLECVKARRFSIEDIERITDAFNFANEAHKDQLRKSGAPYIMHPVAVAMITASELELGANPIIAALLHDVVEDTPHTIDEIETRYGKDVAHLVDVVTKKKKDKYDRSKQVDNYRQILASMQYDIRAVLVKLADRLHNMRTLESMRTDKQLKIAAETQYFYAPLATRLGLYHIKTELENLSFRFRCPHDYKKLDDQLQSLKESDSKKQQPFIKKIKELCLDNSINVRVETNYRRPFNIYRKMQQQGCDFAHADDKNYIRVVYSASTPAEENSIYLIIYGILSRHFKEMPGSVTNYINAPKENGYQSFHVKLLNPDGDWEKIHISSEQMVRHSRLGCTAERTDENIQAWLEKFKKMLQDLDINSHDTDFMEDIQTTMYNDDIMVFTPQGNGIILPKGATAIDFAFEIHSNVGMHAAYARVNGKLCPMRTVLQRGDRIEIGTDPDTHPNPEWLNNAITYKALRNIRGYVNKLPHLDFIRCPHCHPLPGDEVIGFKDKDGHIAIHKRNCLSAIRLASQQGDSIVNVDFKEDPACLYPVRVCIRGIDRYHLLADMVACITDELKLSIKSLCTDTTCNIVECTADFYVHSATELQTAIDSLSKISHVDEVFRVDVENSK